MLIHSISFQIILCQGACPCGQIGGVQIEDPNAGRVKRSASVPFPCQCCEDNPPARCDQIRMVLPCDNAQFQSMCNV